MNRSTIDDLSVSAWAPARRVLGLVLLAGMSLLVVALTAGCGRAQATGPSIGPKTKSMTVASPLEANAAVPALTPEQMAKAQKIVINYGCFACHTIGVVPEAKGIFGPDLTLVGADADKVILTQEYQDSDGQATTGKDYLRESILDPTAYVATDCPEGPCPVGLMPTNFRQQFATHPEDLDLLIDLLYSLK